MNRDAGSSTPKRRGRPPKIRTSVSTTPPVQAESETLSVATVVRQEQATAFAEEQPAYDLEKTPLFIGFREVQKPIYRRVLELLTTVVDTEQRSWQIMQAIFEAILLHLDPEHFGLVSTYATLMPTRADGVHSLVEVFMHGNYPWPVALENHAYLGSTTLAGTAAMLERMQTWDNLSETERLQVEVDEFERSACACPVERGGRIAGVLIISSRRPDFFANAIVCQAALEYAQLLSLAFLEAEFVPFTLLNLVPMPELRWQRAEVGDSYIQRIITCARKFGISRQDAEQRVRIDMEAEFEELGRRLYEQRLSKEGANIPHLPSLS